jgi:hypothetical protein
MSSQVPQAETYAAAEDQHRGVQHAVRSYTHPVNRTHFAREKKSCTNFLGQAAAGTPALAAFADHIWPLGTDKFFALIC